MRKTVPARAFNPEVTAQKPAAATITATSLPAMSWSRRGAARNVAVSVRW
jgi:hypothetical protein